MRRHSVKEQIYNVIQYSFCFVFCFLFKRDKITQITISNFIQVIIHAVVHTVHNMTMPTLIVSINLMGLS